MCWGSRDRGYIADLSLNRPFTKLFKCACMLLLSKAFTLKNILISIHFNWDHQWVILYGMIRVKVLWEGKIFGAVLEACKKFECQKRSTITIYSEWLGRDLAREYTNWLISCWKWFGNFLSKIYIQLKTLSGTDKPYPNLARCQKLFIKLFVCAIS